MAQEELQRVFSEYGAARDEELAGHSFAAWIRNELPKAFEADTFEYPNLKWVASAGQGRWADAPWLAAFDPLATETAREGYYPVYLFNRSLDAVYLSLNQGMANLREELGVQAKATLAHRASMLRAHVSPDYESRFNISPINLQASSSGSRLAFYEPGHAFGIRYSADAIPGEEDLIQDIGEMLRLYTLATFRGGTQELDTTGHAVADLGDEFLEGSTIEEKRRKRLHYRVERNPNLAKKAKQFHGYRCQVCGFEYEREYGRLGREYIEAHHLTPLASLPPDEPVRLSPKDDFAVVCANCHRMIHRRGAPELFEDFVLFYEQVRN